MIMGNHLEGKPDGQVKLEAKAVEARVPREAATTAAGLTMRINVLVTALVSKSRDKYDHWRRFRK